MKNIKTAAEDENTYLPICWSFNESTLDTDGFFTIRTRCQLKVYLDCFYTELIIYDDEKHETTLIPLSHDFLTRKRLAVEFAQILLGYKDKVYLNESYREDTQWVVTLHKDNEKTKIHVVGGINKLLEFEVKDNLEVIIKAMDRGINELYQKSNILNKEALV